MSETSRVAQTEQAWFGSALQELRVELDELQRRGFRIPVEPGGWWHQYVCPEHHAELLFDPLEDDVHSFRCPHGCLIEGAEYRGAWLVFKHQALARYALQAAAVHAGTGERKYAELSTSILLQYAKQFPHYPVHPDAQPWMLKGRAFHQALTEAIWSTTLIRAYLLLVDQGVVFESGLEAWEQFLSLLEQSMVEYRRILVHDRNNVENNYTAWLNASLSCVYAAKGEREKAMALIDDEGGLKHHLTVGVKADQLEFEGSTYYHVFVLRAYLISAEMAERFGIDLYGIRGGGGQTFEGMFDVLADLANEQGELPALHDGPYKRVPYAREIAEIMEIGLAHYGKASYVPVLAEAYRQLNGEGRRAGVEAVVYGKAEADLQSGSAQPAGRQSLLLPDSGFAAARHADNPLSALIDFGPHGGSHGHYDKLHLSLEHSGGTIAPDMGMVPYGSALRKEWFAETASHNTVSVGGKSQDEDAGQCMKYETDAASTYMWMRSTGAYEGCVLDRHLLMTADWMLDWFEVRLEKPDTIDWWLHTLYPLSSSDGTSRWQPFGGALGESSGYSYVKARQLYTAEGDTPSLLHWTCLPPDGVLHVSASVPAGGRLYTIETPGTSVDPSAPAYGLLHRQNGTKASFVYVYSAKEPITISREGDSCAVRSKRGPVNVRMTPQGLVIA